MPPKGLRPQLTSGAQVSESQPGVWRLAIPPGDGRSYRLAQLDDYQQLRRRDFAWRAGTRLELQARASRQPIPGTWGFGLWNDPFSMSTLGGGGSPRLPTLPNAAWFFFASPPNYLSLRDDLPACGALAATFHSKRIPAPLTLLGIPALPFSLIPAVMRPIRRLGRRLVHQDAVELSQNPTNWHAYRIEWGAQAVRFSVDGEVVLHTVIAPQGPLGLVLWVDNQYAATPTGGKLRYGWLPTPPDTWIEVRALKIKRLESSLNGA